MNKIAEELLDWIYPPRCSFCDQVLGRGEKYLCSGCRKKIPVPIQEPRCKKCGKPVSHEEDEYCHDCMEQEQRYEYGQGIFRYEEPLKTSLMKFKFYGRKEYGEFLGKLLCYYGKTMIEHADPQVVIPVPVHRRRRNHRGYNQAEVLAKVLGRGLSIPVRTDLVLRRKSTKAQKELNRAERFKNLEKAFYVNEDAGKYTRVLIVDDIYTTGSTINAISYKLKAAGVKQVFFITVCIGTGM